MSQATSASISPSSAAVQASAYRWVILALAASAFIMAFVSRFAWPPLMPAAMPDLGLTERTQGLALMSAFYLGYILTQVPGGLLCDRFGPRLVLTGALFLQGLGTLGLAFTLNYEASLVLRVICGLGGGCVYSACLKSMVTWFSPAQRGLAIAVVMSAPTVGIAIPNLAMPALESSWGWQGAFQIVGLAVISLAVVMLALMREAAAAPASGSRPSFPVGLKYVLGNRNLRLISLAGFCGLWTQIGFSSVGNDYLVENFGLNLKAAGTVMVLYGLMGLVMSILAGWLSGRFPARIKRMLIISHLLMAAFCLLFGQMGASFTALIGASLIGMAVSFANPLYSIVVADNTEARWMATAGGVSNTIFQLGALFSPLALGLARDLSGSYGWAWPILAVVAILGTVFTALIKDGGRA